MGSSGSFVAILLSVPLTAVALVGVVGVPKIQEMLASATSHGDDDFDPDGFGSRSRSKRGAKSSRGEETDADPWAGEENLDEEFGDFGSKPKSTKSRPGLAKNSRTRNDASLESELDEEPKDNLFSRPGRSRFGESPNDATDVDQVVATEPFGSKAGVKKADFNVSEPVRPAPARGDSFVAAIDRLKAIGGDRFHLVPGLTPGQFLFVCQFETAGESPTIHRFEAESPDPALAVSDVLRQVTAWQSENSIARPGALELQR